MPVADLTPVHDPAPPARLPDMMRLPPLRERWQGFGRCAFREIAVPIPCDHAMKILWKAERKHFIARGYSIRQHNGKWILSQWLAAPREGGYTLTPRGQELLDNLSTPRELPLNYRTSAIVPELPPLPYNLESYLRPYQIQPSRQLYRSLTHGKAEWGYSGAVDLSDMGVGKTYMDLAAALATGLKVAVLCPTVGAAGWNRAFAHFGATPHFIGTYEAVRGGWRSNIATVDENGRFTWKDHKNIILILDEAQALRHDETLTVRCCSAAIRQGIPMIVASATIALSPTEMRFAGRVTGLHQGEHDWFRFLSAHGCERKSSSWVWNKKPHHLQRIHAQLFPMRGCRVRKEDLGEDCPETIMQVLPFEIAACREIEQEWEKVETMLTRLRAQGATPIKLKAIEKKARMRIWMRCEEVLVPYVAEKVKADVAAGRSVAVFMNFNASREAMNKALGTTAGFYGGQPLKKRQHWEAEFQADRQHILINNIGAGGASVSLHDVRGERPRSAYIFPTDHVIRMTQSTGRVDRVGGLSTSMQFIVCLAGSMTVKMVERTRVKMMQIATLNDGHATNAVKF